MTFPRQPIYDEQELLEAARTGRRPQTRQEQMTPPQQPPPPPEPPPKSDRIITSSDRENIIKGAGEAPGSFTGKIPEVTRKITIGKDTTSPQTITDQKIIETIASVQKNVPKLVDVLVSKGIDEYNRAVNKLTKEQRKTFKKEFERFSKQQGIATLERTVQKRTDRARIEANQRELNEFLRTHTEVRSAGDKVYIKNTDISQLKKTNPALADILVKKGIEAYETEIAKYEAATKELSKYPVMVKTFKGGKAGTRPSKAKQIDLEAAYAAGKGPEIRLLYGDETIKELNERKNYKSIKNKFDKDYGGDLGLALIQGMPKAELEQLFDKKTVQNYSAQVDRVGKWKQELSAELKKEKPDYNLVQNRLKNISNASAPVIASYLAGESQLLIGKEILPRINTASKLLTEKLPPVLSLPARYIVGRTAELPFYAANFAFTGVKLISTNKPADYAVNTAKGISQFFLSIPQQIVRDPESAANLAGIFISPNTLKVAGTKLLDPAYVPTRGFTYRFTVNRVNVKNADIAAALKKGELTETQIANAVAKAQMQLAKSPKQPAIVELGKTGIKLELESTPWNRQFGFSLWHGTPEKNPFIGKNFVVELKESAKQRGEAGLFTSTQAAPRFAIASASGEPGLNPAFVLIYTKKGVKPYPAAIKYAETITEMRKSGYDYLGSYKAEPGAYAGPVKAYQRNAYERFFENESLLPVGMKLDRVTNLRSRLLGAPAGEFVTVVNNKIVPIFRFAEPGAKVPKSGLLDLATIRIVSAIETMAHIRSGIRLQIPTFRSVKEELSARIKELEEILKRRGKKQSEIDTATKRLIETETRRRILNIYEPNRVALERAYKANQENFEQRYLNRVIVNLKNITGGRRVLPPAKAAQKINIRRDIARAARLDKARALTPAEQIKIDQRPFDGVRQPEISRLGVLSRPRAEIDRINVTTPDGVRKPQITAPDIERPTPEKRRPPTDTPRGRPPGRPPTEEKPPKTTPKEKRGKDKDKEELTPEQIRSAIAWKDGFIIHALISPYRRKIDEYSFNEKSAPPGLNIINAKRSLSGKGSQQRSAQITGTLRERLTVDIGNQDLIITPDRSGKRVTFKFKRDRTGTKSRLTVKNSGRAPKFPSDSRKVGRQYFTKTNGGTIISRRRLRRM